MRKEILFFLCFISGLSAFAQEPIRNVVKLNPTAIFFNSGILTYERVVAHNMSFEFGPAVEQYDRGKHSIGIFAAYRFYTANDRPALERFYVAPGISYVRSNAGNILRRYGPLDDVAPFNSLQMQAVAGYQLPLSQHLALDANAGIRYLKRYYKGDGFRSFYSRMFPSVSLGVGYRF